ncbi:MAG: hypothetical protein WC456_01770 [Patescibacteria group bacterium]
MLEIKVLVAPVDQKHPPEILESLVDCVIPVADNEVVKRFGRSDLIENNDFVVTLPDLIRSLQKAGKKCAVKYWRKYFCRNTADFVCFKLTEVKLIY